MEKFLKDAQLDILAIVKSNYNGKVTFKNGQINLVDSSQGKTANVVVKVRNTLC